ncbi:hypothetical protein GCM10018955_33850 [Planomonospora venezuelensis]
MVVTGLVRLDPAHHGLSGGETGAGALIGRLEEPPGHLALAPEPVASLGAEPYGPCGKVFGGHGHLRGAGGHPLLSPSVPQPHLCRRDYAAL